MTSVSQSKKRKHRDPSENGGAAHRKMKERRETLQTTQPAAPPSQKPSTKSPKEKGKSRVSDHPTEFRIVNASLVLSIPPVFASDLRAGAEEMLDSMVMRYIPSLQGVLLAHSNVQFLSQNASIIGDCPFAVCHVSFDATVWGPQISMKLVGKINLCSPDHISLLVHRTFNVSIPRHHIPRDQWLFEYGPAENDPEFGEGRDRDAGVETNGTDDKGDVEMSDSGEQKTSIERETENGGRWVHHLTGLKLGDPDGYVEFTVIGLTVANEMLSLQGSIQLDPFSPEHVPHCDNKEPSSTFSRDGTPEIATHDEKGEEEEEEEEDESDEDGFRHLAKLTDKAKAAQKAKRAREEAERLEKAKKRKRQETDGGVSEKSPSHGKRGDRKRTKDKTL